MSSGKMYYVVQEWSYPRGNGGGATPQVTDGPFASLSDAEAAALGIAETARASFAHETGSDPLPVKRLEESDMTPPEKTVFLVSAAKDYWFASKVLELESGRPATPRIDYATVDGQKLPYRVVEVPGYGLASVSSTSAEETVIGADGEPVSLSAEGFDANILYYVRDADFTTLTDEALGRLVADEIV